VVYGVLFVPIPAAHSSGALKTHRLRTIITVDIRLQSLVDCVTFSEQQQSKLER